MADIGSLRIVVFPWLAFGHMLPFLALSKSLARRGHHITFISTPRNIERLPKVPPQISHLIDFISFTLPKVEGLSNNAEATTDCHPEEVEYLKKAFDGLETPFSMFIKEAFPKPDWIIQDYAQYWIPPIAAEIGVRTIYFSVMTATNVGFLCPMMESISRWSPEELTVSPPWVTFHSKVAFRLYEARDALDHLKQQDIGVSVADTIAMTLKGCDAVAPRSCRELEPEWLDLIPKIYKKPCIPVGLLPPQVDEILVENDNQSKPEIFKWLDKQCSSSVVYIALGSEATLSSELLHELAYGLELAKLPFLWVLRRPDGSSSDSMEMMLPEGFEKRTRGYGIVEKGWIPQVRVLSNGSVGGFLTHCGWSSVIESLQFGHPLVLLPLFGDQCSIARIMGQKGIGIEVERKQEDGSFTREEVAKALRLVMVEDEGQSCRKKAKEMREILANKELHDRYMDNFVEFLKSH